MAKKKRNKFKAEAQRPGAVSEINEFFQCDLRPDNWPEIVLAKTAETWSTRMGENLRAYLETHRNTLDFDWAKWYLLFTKEILYEANAPRVLQRAGPLSKYPPCYPVKLEVGEIYRTDQGQMLAAKAVYEELVALDPGMPEGHHYLGVALGALGIYERAAEAFRRALETARKDDDEIKARAHYNLGVLLEGYYRRDFKAARRHVEEALRWMPDYPQAQVILGQLRAHGDVYINEPGGVRGRLAQWLFSKTARKTGAVALHTYRFPTQEAGRRFMRLQCEGWANTATEDLGGLTPYEAALEGRSFREMAHACRLGAVVGAPIAKYYEEAVRVDRRTLSYEQVYRSDGGLLNLFNEPVRAEDDRQRHAARAEFERSLEPQEAEKRALAAWWQTPNELFSLLTPAHVWAGGGIEEARLAQQFAELITEGFKDRKFSTQGEMIFQSMVVLRQWLLTPASGQRGPSRQDVIIAERTAILQRKMARLQRRGLSEYLFLS